MSLARELVEADDVVQAQWVAWERETRSAGRADPQPGGVTEADWKAVLDAIAAGSADNAPHARDLQAAYLTTRMTDAELAAAASFMKSPAGRAWRARVPALSVRAP